MAFVGNARYKGFRFCVGDDVLWSYRTVDISVGVGLRLAMPVYERGREVTPLTYESFIDQKHKRHKPSGFNATNIHENLFEFQAATVKWSLAKGKASIFAGTGLGKTRMQCEYARHIEGYRLIVAPLAVGQQTINEAQDALQMRLRPARERSNITEPAVYVTNYDRIHLFEDVKWDAVVLDESSIIKSHDGEFRRYLTERFADTPFKLCCTATPSPNDHIELGTHAEFMGAMSRSEMLATFFVHDGGDTSKWRLKGHAKADFWKWVASWAAVYSHPSDIGFDIEGYDLPPIEFIDHTVDVPSTVAGGLFGDSKVNASQVYAVLRESADARAEVAAAIVNEDKFLPTVIWCNTDAEQNILEKLIPYAASVRGSQTIEQKEKGLMDFSGGAVKHLITKPKIGGYGMNWQHCHRMIFCGVTYSFEQVYQAIRRSWRFGQKHPVQIHFVTCNAQESIKASLKAKEEAFKTMAQEMSKYCTQEIQR